MKKLIFGIVLAWSGVALSWDGYDWDNRSFVEINKNNTVRSGKDIEVYDYSKGEYKTYEVESVRKSGTHVDVEVQDPDDLSYRTLEMK